MKWVLAVLLVVHGLIHLMGFAKAFGLGRTLPLQQPISRPVGLLWLLAAVLFVTSALLLLAAARWWWVPAAPAVLVSQALVFTAWSDAKFGTVANVITLVPLVVSLMEYSESSFRSIYRREVVAGLSRAAAAAQPITPSDLAHLPAPVRRYLEYVGVVGKDRVHGFRARFRGEIRSKPDAGWMPFEADQTSFFDPPARLFLIRSSMAGIPFDALHLYVGPNATMQVKIASLLQIVDARGPEMNQSETVTVFNDMCVLAPATLVDRAIRWEEVDDRTARATYSNAGNTISAVLRFDDEGRLVDFHSDDRYQSADGKTYVKYRWSTPLRDYRDFGGHRLARAGEAIWQMPDGPLTYGRFELVELEYNVKQE